MRTRTHGKEDGKEEDGKGELHTMDSSGTRRRDRSATGDGGWVGLGLAIILLVSTPLWFRRCSNASGSGSSGEIFKKACCDLNPEGSEILSSVRRCI